MLIGQQVGPFLVEKELGSGAMGSVYLARYKDGPRVALKFMSPSLSGNERSLARFEREAEILKQLKHPNIVRLFGHGKSHGTRYFAMEFIEGESLDKILARRQRLPWEEVVNLGQQLCSALQHAHQQGIVHRDLKPSNLLILPDGTLKLADFGIAKDLDVTQLTSANCTVGTAWYMSPEQCRGERNLSHKSDLYSLGIVFYEMLTGRKPFNSENIIELFQLHIQGTCERPSRLVMDIPIWLDTLVCHLLEKQPDKRPFDAAMVASALGQISEKVAALQSAGVDVVTARTVDRLTGAPRPDAEDKKAARSLRSALGKTRRKRKGKPFYQRAWFQALGIGAALLGVGALIVVALMPPRPEKLYASAKRAWDSGDFDKRRDACEPPRGAIYQYLRYYPDRTDEPAQDIRQWADEIKTDQRERSLLIRYRKGFPPDDDFEAEATQIIRKEEAGNFKEAFAGWQELLKQKNDSSREVRVYGILAERRLRDLQMVADRFQELERKVDQIRTGQKIQPESPAEDTALLGLRLDQFGDWSEARSCWKQLKFKYEKDPENRIWFLLGAWQSQAPKPKKPDPDDPETRTKLVQDCLAKAKDLAAQGKKVEARALCREMVELYSKKEEVKGPVNQAQELMDKLTPQD